MPLRLWAGGALAAFAAYWLYCAVGLAVFISDFDGAKPILGFCYFEGAAALFVGALWLAWGTRARLRARELTPPYLWLRVGAVGLMAAIGAYVFHDILGATIESAGSALRTRDLAAALNVAAWLSAATAGGWLVAAIWLLQPLLRGRRRLSR